MRHRTLLRFIVLLIIAGLGTTALIPTAATEAASDIVVNSSSDDSNPTDGQCTLREAIIAANLKARSGLPFGECAAGGQSTIIRFSITEPIVLSRPLPGITSDVTLLGDSETEPSLEQPVTISGAGQHRILVVRMGTVRIRSIHFTQGRAQGGDGGTGIGGGGGGGGGAGMGGALYIVGGAVTIENARFTNNVAQGGNGGDAISNGATTWGGGGGGGMTNPGEASLPSKGGDGGGGTVFDDDAAPTPGGLPGRQGGDAADGAGGGGAGPGTAERGGFGGYGGGGGGARGGIGPGGYAGAGGFGGGGGGGSHDGSKERGANGGGMYGGGGGHATSAHQGGGGGGGAGLGGAIFIQSGSHALINSTFAGNSAVGGRGGTGSVVGSGADGEALGGAIFLAGNSRLYSMSESNPFSLTQPNLPQDVAGPGFIPQTVVSIKPGQNPSIAGSPGTFLVSRLGSITDALEINVKLTGTAKLGDDYTIDGHTTLSTLRFREGESTIEVKVNAALNNLEAVGRTITLELVDGPGYTLDAFPQATLTITSLPAPAWLILLYVAAEDLAPQPATSDTLAVSLTEPAGDMLSRLRNMQANPNVRVVVLFDGNSQEKDTRILVLHPGMSGNFQDMTPLIAGSGAWTGFPYDAQTDQVELDTGRVETLRSFIEWARKTYPDAKHTMLSVIDHGGGWAPDFGSQQGQPKVNRYRLAGDGRGLSTDAQSGRSLSTRNTGEVFTGLGDLGQFDLVFFDACLMGMVESAYEIQPYTRYFVAGQNLLWAELPYERHFGKITQDTTPEQLAANLVADYGTTLTEPHTIAAVEMAQLPALRASITRLAEALLNHLDAHPGAASDIRDAYIRAQKFDYDVSMSIDDETDAYVDLRSIAQEIRAKNFSSSVNAAADEVVTALGRAVLAPGARVGSISEIETDNGTAVWDLSRASGLSIYMPLGERDCRPTALMSQGTPSLPCNIPGEPIMEEGEIVDVRLYQDQFHYYSDPNQLAFTRDAKPWSDLLQKVRDTLGDQLREPTLIAGKRTTAPPYLLQTEPLTVTTGAAQAGAVAVVLNGALTTGTWGERRFEVTSVSGNYSQAITTTQLLTKTISVTETQYLALIENLEPATTYYYRLVANRGGKEIAGQELSFTTDYFRVRMPLIRNETRADLEVVSIQVIPAQPRVGQEAEVQVTIRNNGPGAVGPAFWVDLYVNPRTDLELKPNVLWNEVAPFGAAWRVYGLQHGETKVLSTKLTGDGLDLAARYSEFSRFIQEGKNRLVVQIDSYQPGDDRGAVDEAREENNLHSLEVNVISDQEPLGR